MAGIYKDDSWLLAEAEVDGQPLVIRARTRLPALPDIALHPELVVISRTYEAGPGGMPASKVTEGMARLEEALEASVEKRSGVLAATLTGNGRKEWRYYTYDKDEFMSELNFGLAGHTAYPVQIEVFEDPEWNALLELLPERA